MFEDSVGSIPNKAVTSGVVPVTVCLPGMADVNKEIPVRPLGRGIARVFTR